MKKESNNIIKIILQNKKVNNYTKLMIILNTLDYYEDYYIPNRKLMNQLSIRKHRLIGLLHQLEEDEIIKVFYKGRKRYFTFIGKVRNNREEIEETDYKQGEFFDYNWLEED